MKRLIVSGLLFWTLNCGAQITAKVVEVRDGDSFHVVWNGKRQLCRLAHVDAPELKQSFGIAARDSVRKVILGKTVLIDSLSVDLYKRVIVNLKVKGICLDSLMIRKGWAWNYLAYSKNKNFALLMKDAIVEKKGIWKCGTDGVYPPWLYRKYTLENKIKHCISCN